MKIIVDLLMPFPTDSVLPLSSYTLSLSLSQKELCARLNTFIILLLITTMHKKYIFFHLTFSRWALFHPACVHSLRIFPSLPDSRLTKFYRDASSDASSGLLQLVDQSMVEFYLLTFSCFPLRKK